MRGSQVRIALAATLIAVGLGACAAVGSGMGGGGVTICEHYKDSPIPAGYESPGCWTYSEYFAQADEVIPVVEASAPRLRIEGSGNAPMGIEGSLFFVRAVSPSGRVVLHREWDWPSLSQQIPPGAYQVTAFVRGCDGNCDNLDPPGRSCTIDVLAEPSMNYIMSYAFIGNEVNCDVESNPAHDHQPID